MIAITTRSSMSVKPFRLFTAFPPRRFSYTAGMNTVCVILYRCLVRRMSTSFMCRMGASKPPRQPKNATTNRHCACKTGAGVVPDAANHNCRGKSVGCSPRYVVACPQYHRYRDSACQEFFAPTHETKHTPTHSYPSTTAPRTATRVTTVHAPCGSVHDRTASRLDHTIRSRHPTRTPGGHTLRSHHASATHHTHTRRTHAAIAPRQRDTSHAHPEDTRCDRTTGGGSACSARHAQSSGAS